MGRWGMGEARLGVLLPWSSRFADDGRGSQGHDNAAGNTPTRNWRPGRRGNFLHR